MSKNTFPFSNFLLEPVRYPPRIVQRETHKWKFSGDIFGSGNSGQAMVYKAKRRLPPYELAALKSFEKKFLKEGPSRSYREFIAMDRLKGMLYTHKKQPLWNMIFTEDLRFLSRNISV